MHLLYDKKKANKCDEKRAAGKVLEEIGIEYKAFTNLYTATRYEYIFWFVSGELDDLPEYITEVTLEELKENGFEFFDVDETILKNLT